MAEKRYVTARRFLNEPDGAIIVKRSQAEKPYYLCRVTNDWPNLYYGEHALIGEEFATREEAEARARELWDAENPVDTYA